MLFRQILQYLLDDTGWTKYRLSKELNCSQSSVANWLNGTSVPQRGMKIRIAEAFHVDVDFLTGQSNAGKLYFWSKERDRFRRAFETENDPAHKANIESAYEKAVSMVDALLDAGIPTTVPFQENETNTSSTDKHPIEDEFTYAAHKYTGMLSNRDKSVIITMMETFAAANEKDGEHGETD